MAVRLMLVPIQTAGSVRGPKYFEYSGAPASPAPLFSGVKYAMMDFGLEPTALMAADVSAGQITTLQGLSDVTLIPANLDNTLGANLATVQTSLEALNIPADVTTSSHTYRQVLRGVIAIFSVAQRFYGMRGTTPDGGRLFPSGITLSSTVGDLPANARADLKTAAEALGYDYSAITVSSTMRQVLKQLASQAVPCRLLETDI